MIQYLKLFLLISMLITARSWSANNLIYFPLQVGNSWKYFWGYELPECCNPQSANSNQCSLFECIIEGAVTVHKIESSFVHNNRTYFVYAIYEATYLEEYRLLHKDTLCLINNCIYKFSGTEHCLWLNFNNPDTLYTFQTQPEDTFAVQYFNRQFGTFPIHSALFNVKNKLTTDSLIVTNKKIYGQFYKIEYTKVDTNRACWIENYWPGIGLAYSSYPNNSRYIALQSAIIDGDSIKVGIKQHRVQPEFVKESNSTDDCIFDIRGNQVPPYNRHSRYGSTPVGIYVSKSGRKMISLRNFY
jgi:hypothetical protein